MTSTGTLRGLPTDEEHVDWGPTKGVPREIAVIFWSRSGVETRELADGGRLRIGRSEPADVVVRDKSLSRLHAELRNEAGRVWVRDLDSLNGIFVRGNRINGDAEVHIGDELRLGGVIAQLRSRPAKGSSAVVEPLDQFLSRLEEELVRARSLGRVGTLLMLRPSEAVSSDERDWCARVRQRLRPVDRMAAYGTRFALALLPEVPLSEARGVVAVLAGVTHDELLCGAAGYPEAAQTFDELLTSVHDACRRATPSEPLCLPTGERPREESGGVDMVVVSPAMKRLETLARRVASVDATALILGETGVGKELIASSLHRNGPRRHKPFRAVNCGALPQTLAESLLFGHERGSFTGAAQRTKGVFEQADGGTVFLDEVGELSLPTQAVLLRVLESKRVARVGSTEEIAVNVRLVAATHRDLEAMVRSNEFRADLYYRLNTLTLTVPPLRERPEEVAPLAEMFLRRASQNWEIPVASLHPEALAMLTEYEWPGNVRELRNVIERAVIVGGAELRVEHLPEYLRRDRDAPPASQSFRASRGAVDDAPYRERIKNLEAELIREALAKCGGSRKRTADALQMPLRTLMAKMKAFGIKD
jgi:DNA-binding NtrC family response regulator